MHSTQRRQIISELQQFGVEETIHKYVQSVRATDLTDERLKDVYEFLNGFAQEYKLSFNAIPPLLRRIDSLGRVLGDDVRRIFRSIYQCVAKSD